ncbi:gas vesicle K [mine drainage metagenome]|uniref:Gas vesicle K n=1 Tax=mine drainage metagenome TaxID=410659 RepID=T1AV79_9ZZZZ
MGRQIAIDEENVRQGLLGLVIALVEVVHSALKLQAVRRMESGSLTSEEVDRLGRTLLQLENEIAAFKREQGLEEAVDSVRKGLDDIADDVLDTLLLPVGWGDHEDVP